MNDFEKGEALNELKNSKFWDVLELVRDDLLKDLETRINSDVRHGTPLISEPNLAAILSSRMAEMGGVARFFALMEKLNSNYIEKMRKEDMNKTKGVKNG